MKVVKILIKILIIAVLLTAVFFIARRTFKDFKYKKHAPLTGYSSSYGGDMQGSYRLTEIKRVDDEHALVTIAESEWHYMDIEYKEYNVSADVLSEIEKIYDKEKLYRLQDAPRSKYIVMDAGTSSYQFSFADDESISFSSGQAISSKGYDALREIAVLIKEAAEKGERLPGLVLEEPSEDDEWYNPYTEGEVSIRITEYRDHYITYYIGNGLEKDIEVDGTEKLYFLGESDEWTETAELIEDESSDYSKNVPGLYADEYTLSFPGKRLQAGYYLLEVGEYTKIFEVR